MPLVTIRVTGGSEAPTPEQKKELIRGATDLLVRVLGQNPATTTVIIDEVTAKTPVDTGVGRAFFLLSHPRKTDILSKLF